MHAIGVCYSKHFPEYAEKFKADMNKEEYISCKTAFDNLKSEQSKQYHILLDHVLFLFFAAY